MSQIRHVYIKNFRAVKELEWFPTPGLNCLIGPGDSGKSTILDAIDLALGARRSYPFTDADFFQLDTTSPIEIFVTVGALDVQLKNIEAYGRSLRGYEAGTREISDEPQAGQEDVLTVRLTVGRDLDPDWLLYSDRAQEEGLERRLQWKHRELITPARLGVTSDHHLAWGNRSLLNKLSEEGLDLTATLAELSRSARDAFAEHEIEGISGVLEKVKTLARNLGVDVGDLKALLDAKSVSLSHGAISLHNNDNTPLRQLGTGSSRLLISAIQKAATTSRILIVDEAEFGLEPFRITRLLNELGSKEPEPEQQVFITTHSPYVLKELQANQLHVVRARAEGMAPFPPPLMEHSHKIYSLQGDDVEQSTLRTCSEAFFSRAVIVCEGKTEIGLVRGIDLHRQATQETTIYSNGTYCADGGGDSMFQRAGVFRALGYPTSIFKDSDKNTEQGEAINTARGSGINLYEWGNALATENALFLYSPADTITQLLELAIMRKSRDSIAANIESESGNTFSLDDCLANFNDAMRPILGAAAKNKGWYKDIEPAEQFARKIVGPRYSDFDPAFTQPINELFQWSLGIGV